MVTGIPNFISIKYSLYRNEFLWPTRGDFQPPRRVDDVHGNDSPTVPAISYSNQGAAVRPGNDMRQATELDRVLYHNHSVFGHEGRVGDPVDQIGVHYLLVRRGQCNDIEGLRGREADRSGIPQRLQVVGAHYISLPRFIELAPIYVSLDCVAAIPRKVHEGGMRSASTERLDPHAATAAEDVEVAGAHTLVEKAEGSEGGEDSLLNLTHHWSQVYFRAVKAVFWCEEKRGHWGG